MLYCRSRADRCDDPTIADEWKAREARAKEVVDKNNREENL
jgi:hypothetical protein